MRTAHVLFAGMIAGALTAPVLAKSSNTHEAEEKSSASTCSRRRTAHGKRAASAAIRPRRSISRRPRGRSRKRAEPDAAPIQLWCGPLMIFMASAM
jgi:hypothetical protein